jgi:ribose transport system ATP-binding protein
MTLEEQYILKTKGICKSFGGIEVLHSIDFDLRLGEVHVLIGENGAGKSTLMKIIAGAESPDKGEIYLNDPTGVLNKVDIKNPKVSQDFGISMVFQESNLIDNLSIAENIYLGREPLKNGFIDWTRLYKDTKNQLEIINSQLDPKMLVGTLSVAEKQTIEIAKALAFRSTVIIFDEPTSSLSDREVEMLFNLIRETTSRSVGVIYISHRMEEILQIGDRITVFRDGSLIKTVDAKLTDTNELIRMMVGRDLEDDGDHKNLFPSQDKPFLQIRNIRIPPCETAISFDVKKGDVLGIFGLVGAGRTELARILFGIDPINEGEIIKQDEKITNANPSSSIKNGFALLPEDRKTIGLIPGLSIRENLTLVKLMDLKKILWNRDKETAVASEYMQKLSVSAVDQEQLVSHLSGGNQQKVVFGKWLCIKPEIIILDEPTRGIDIRTKSEIYSLLNHLSAEGVTILLISSDLPEILRVCNRVIVMHDKHITLDEKREAISQEIIMDAAVR